MLLYNSAIKWKKKKKKVSRVAHIGPNSPTPYDRRSSIGWFRSFSFIYNALHSRNPTSNRVPPLTQPHARPPSLSPPPHRISLQPTAAGGPPYPGRRHHNQPHIKLERVNWFFSSISKTWTNMEHRRLNINSVLFFKFYWRYM
jgi:hypothetical protein